MPLNPETTRNGWMIGQFGYGWQEYPFNSMLHGGANSPSSLNIFSDGLNHCNADGDIVNCPSGVSFPQSYVYLNPGGLEAGSARLRSGVYRLRWTGNAKLKITNYASSSSIVIGSGPGHATNNVAGVSPMDITITHPDPSGAPYTPAADCAIGWAMDAHGSAICNASHIRLYHVDDEAAVLAGKLFQAGWARPLKNAAKIRIVKMQSAEYRGTNSYGSTLPGGRLLNINDFPRMSNNFYNIVEEGAVRSVLPFDAAAQLCLENNIPVLHIVFPHNMDNGTVAAACAQIYAINPSLTIEIEVDNEIWNAAYPYLGVLPSYRTQASGSTPTPTVGRVIEYAGPGYGPPYDVPGTIIPDTAGDFNGYAYSVAADVLCAYYAEALTVFPVGQVKMLIGTQDAFMVQAGHFNQWWYIDPRTGIRMKDHPHVGHSSAPYMFLGKSTGVTADPYVGTVGEAISTQWLTEQSAGNWDEDTMFLALKAYIDLLKTYEDSGNAVVASYQATNPGIYWDHYEWGFDFTACNYYYVDPAYGRSYKFNQSGGGDSLTWDVTQGGRNGANAFTSGEEVYAAAALSGRAKKLSGNVAVGTQQKFFITKTAGTPVLKLFETDAERITGTNWITMPAGSVYLHNYTRLHGFNQNVRTFMFGHGGLRVCDYAYRQLSRGKARRFSNFLMWGNCGEKEVFGRGQTQFAPLNAAQKWALSLNYRRN